MFNVIAGLARLAPFGRRFADEQRGTVAVIFALVALPLLGVISVAIDYGRATHVQTILQNAVDAATGSAIRLAGAESDVIRASFHANFRANLPKDLKETPYQLVVDKDKGVVQAKLESKVPTSFLGIMGVAALDVAAESSAKFAKPSNSDSGRGGSGAPSSPFEPAPPAGGVKPGGRPALSGEVERKLRGMGYDLDDPELRRRAAEAEAKMRELIAQNPGLLRRR